MSNKQFVFSVCLSAILGMSLTFNVVYHLTLTQKQYIFNESAPDGVYIVYYFDQTYTACSKDEVFFGYCNPNIELVGYWKIQDNVFSDGEAYYKVAVINNIIYASWKIDN